MLSALGETCAAQFINGGYFKGKVGVTVDREGYLEVLIFRFIRSWMQVEERLKVHAKYKQFSMTQELNRVIA